MKIVFIAVLIYLAAVNLTGLILMRTDKRRAERNMWRISEAALFFPAFLGGTIGCIAGMYIFHHKTRHLKFVIGMPLLLTVQVLAVLYLVFRAPFTISFM